MRWAPTLRATGMALALMFAAEPAQAERFQFVAIGDVPYTSPSQLDRLIERINQLSARFTLHVGDIKSGSTLCSDETFEAVKRQFMSFDQPLIYTPGDNEWTDCHRKNNGPYDPLERLQKLRQMFFASDFSLGRHPLPLDSQSRTEDFRDFSENRRWHSGEVSFATVHLVGSNNNWQPELPSSREFASRNRANMAWMRETFAQAKRQGHHAVVFAMQADTFYHDPRIKESGVAEWLEAFRQEAIAWGKPVLLIQGDTHQFTVDRPFAQAHAAASNVLRLVVPGEQSAEAVLIEVDTSNTAEPFSVRLLER